LLHSNIINLGLFGVKLVFLAFFQRRAVKKMAKILLNYIGCSKGKIEMNFSVLLTQASVIEHKNDTALKNKL
jgi:hypothetical protein